MHSWAPFSFFFFLPLIRACKCLIWTAASHFRGEGSRWRGAEGATSQVSCAIAADRGAEEESADSRLAGGGRAARTLLRRSISYLKIPTPTPPFPPLPFLSSPPSTNTTTSSSSSSLVIDSFATRSIRQTGRIWGGGRQGRRGRKAITSGRFDPIANTEQAGDLPLRTWGRHSGSTGGIFSPRSTFGSRLHWDCCQAHLSGINNNKGGGQELFRSLHTNSPGIQIQVCSHELRMPF